MKIVTSQTPKVNIHAILTPQEIDGIHHHIHHYPQPRAAVLDALKLVQKRNGWVDDAQVHAIAHMLSMPVADVEGVATFFNRIYRMPVGRHVILICDSIACYLNGYEALADAFKRELGIDYGQTTKMVVLPYFPFAVLATAIRGRAC